VNFSLVLPFTSFPQADTESCLVMSWVLWRCA
jgi:hypothetical protein